MDAHIEVVYYANVVRMTFRDVEKARIAYDKIKTALAEYRMFKNDRVETVEVDAEACGLSTLKLERMDAVLFNEPQEFDAERYRKDMENEKRLRDMRQEIGLPPTVVGRR